MRVVNKSSLEGKYLFAAWFKNQGKAVDVTGNEANDAPPFKNWCQIYNGNFYK